MKVMTINPNTECKAGKLYKLAFRTGAHDRKRKDARRDRRDFSRTKRDFF